MNAMLTDEELERLLAEAAGSFAVPAADLDLPKPVQKPVWQRRWPQAGAAAAGIVALSLALSTVGGGGVASDKNASSAPQRAAAGAEELGGTTGGTTGTTGGGADLAYGALSPPVAAPAPAPGSAVVTSGTSSSGATAALGDPDTARVVKTGTLSLVVDKGRVTDTVRALNRLVTGFQGYIADSTSNEVGDNPSATITVRVPASAFGTLIDRVRGMKVKVVTATEAGKDVTASYADTQAQIQSLRAARDRYLAILARARTIAETLTVQQRVDDVQRQIDQLEGQRRVLADQSDYGTITISVAEKADAEAFIKSEPSGWSKAWHDAKHGFSSGVQRLIAGSGRTLLVLLCGAALLLLGRTGWRLARRRLV